jgi:hypothetical protein
MRQGSFALDDEQRVYLGMHQCPGTKRDGQPCKAWVFPRFETCRWHRPRRTSEEQEQQALERKQRRRALLVDQLDHARSMLARCPPDEPGIRRSRKGWVRRIERDLAKLDESLRSLTESKN